MNYVQCNLRFWNNTFLHWKENKELKNSSFMYFYLLLVGCIIFVTVGMAYTYLLTYLLSSLLWGPIWPKTGLSGASWLNHKRAAHPWRRLSISDAGLSSSQFIHCFKSTRVVAWKCCKILCSRNMRLAPPDFFWFISMSRSLTPSWIF